MFACGNFPCQTSRRMVSKRPPWLSQDPLSSNPPLLRLQHAFQGDLDLPVPPDAFILVVTASASGADLIDTHQIAKALQYRTNRYSCAWCVNHSLSACRPRGYPEGASNPVSQTFPSGSSVFARPS